MGLLGNPIWNHWFGLMPTLWWRAYSRQVTKMSLWMQRTTLGEDEMNGRVHNGPSGYMWWTLRLRYVSKEPLIPGRDIAEDLYELYLDHPTSHLKPLQ